MGILNVTPDSFSDGGNYMQTADAVRAAQQMLADGADIIDIGGESTRPGAAPVGTQQQIDRVLPAILAIKKAATSAIISIDTTNATVAKAAIAAGASIINDISGGEADSDILSVASKHHTPIVLMHRQGTPATMQNNPHYDDVVGEVISHLHEKIKIARLAGVAKGQIIIDPGIGFGKTKQHNLQLLAQLPQLVALGFPVLLGCSRKRFMGSICKMDQPKQLLHASTATTALGVAAGVRIFRVHDVLANRQAAAVAHAIVRYQ